MKSGLFGINHVKGNREKPSTEAIIFVYINISKIAVYIYKSFIPLKEAPFNTTDTTF